MRKYNRVWCSAVYSQIVSSARGVFHRNFSQTCRQGDSGKYRKRRAADRNTCRSRRRNGPDHHPGAERMLTDLEGADQVYIACGYTDLRRGTDGLASLVQQQFEWRTGTTPMPAGNARRKIRRRPWRRRRESQTSSPAALPRQSIPLSRQTMSNRLLWPAEHLLTPVYDLPHEELLKRDVLHADETTLQVLHEPGKSAQSNSYMWLYRTSGDTGRPTVLFGYQPGRGACHPKTFLAGFTERISCSLILPASQRAAR